MNTWFIGCFSKKIKLSLSQKRLFVSWICWCCNYAFFLSRMLHLRAFLSRMSWLRAFWRWILRRIFGRNPQKYAEFWQKICGKSWPLEPLIQTHAQKLNETCLNLSKGIPPHLPSNKPCSLVGGPMSHHFAGISEMMSLHCKISLFLDSKSLLVHAQCPVELFCRSICKRKAKEAWGNFNSIAFVCLSVTFPSQFGEVFFFRDFRGGPVWKQLLTGWHLELFGGGQSGT